jgi:hypothetical protein
MRPISNEARVAAQRSHRRASRLSILDYNLHPTGDVFEGDAGYVLAGAVHMDRTRDVRRTCDFTIANPDGLWTPTDVDDLFYWNRSVKLERGIYLDDDTVEWFSLGVFIIDQPTVTVAPAGASLRITGVDRMDRLLRARFYEPYYVPAGSDAPRALLFGMANTYAAMTTAYPNSSVTIGPADFEIITAADRTWETGESVIDAFRQSANDFNLEPFVDADGVLQIDRWVDPILAPLAWSFAPGDDAIITGLAKTWSKDRLYNRILVRGESALGEVSVSAQAAVDDPANPAHANFQGDRLFLYTSAMIATTGQAQDTADRFLVEHALIEEELSVGFVPVPALEVGDVVEIIEPISGTNDRYQIQRMTMPLGPGGATFDVRKLRSLLT